MSSNRFYPYGPLCENVTSSTNPKVVNTLHCRCRSTENLAKFGRVIFEICERTDGQTDRQTYRDAHRNTSLTFRGQSHDVVLLAPRLFVWACKMWIETRQMDTAAAAAAADWQSLSAGSLVDRWACAGFSALWKEIHITSGRDGEGEGWYWGWVIQCRPLGSCYTSSLCRRVCRTSFREVPRCRRSRPRMDVHVVRFQPRTRSPKPCILFVFWTSLTDYCAFFPCLILIVFLFVFKLFCHFSIIFYLCRVLTVRQLWADDTIR